MPPRITAAQNEKLSQLHSTARWKHRRRDGQDVTICVIQDIHMGKDWCQAEFIGSGDAAEEQALELALAQAAPGDRPLTPAEMASRLAEYKARFGDIETESPPPKPARKKSE